LPTRRNSQNESIRSLARNSITDTDAALESCSSLAAAAEPTRSVASDIDDIDLDALFASFEAVKPVSSTSPANKTTIKLAPLVPLAPPLASAEAETEAEAALATTQPEQLTQPGATAHADDDDAPPEIPHDQPAEAQLAPPLKPVSKPSRLRWFAMGAAFGIAVVIGTMRLAVSRYDDVRDAAMVAARFAVGHGWNASPSPELPPPLSTTTPAGEPGKAVEVATPPVAMPSEAPVAKNAAPVATNDDKPTSESSEHARSPEPASHPAPAKPSVEAPVATTPERPEHPEHVVKKQVAPAAPTTPKATPTTTATPRANVALHNARPATPADKPKPQKPPASSGEGRAASAPTADPADIFGAALKP
jgi:hypothetical protein